MAIAEGYKANFKTLVAAIKNNDVCIVECKDATTGHPVIAVCAVTRTEDEYEMMPLAKLFDGNPYNELIPPMVEEAT